MKYLAFDIEIFKVVPKDAPDWKPYRPLGISCAATMASTGEAPLIWYENDYAPMKKPLLLDMFAYLCDKEARGYKILTWNGLGFDFDVLAEESGADCADLALNHIDMMFHLFCLKGFPLGLNAAALGMGLPGKTEGMDGALAPELWQNGEYEKVLEYVSQDVRTTLALAQAVDAAGKLNWTAKSGRANSVPIPRWLTCREALDLPLPDTKWMTDPWSRRKFTEWIPAQPLPDVEF
jgi:hypothetical protein